LCSDNKTKEPIFFFVSCIFLLYLYFMALLLNGVISAINVPRTPTITVSGATLASGDYTISTSNGRTFLNFKATGKTMTLSLSYGPVNTTYLAIGGGGGGGGWAGGGGGAGGLQTSTSYSLLTGVYNINIGAGGSGGINTGTDSGNGTDTTIGSIITARGGGGGGGVNFNNGKNGGCGGGAWAGTAGTGSQGFSGGTGGGSNQGGAGGGGGKSTTAADAGAAVGMGCFNGPAAVSSVIAFSVP
jgi:hypothetical protein